MPSNMKHALRKLGLIRHISGSRVWPVVPGAALLAACASPARAAGLTVGIKSHIKWMGGELRVECGGTLRVIACIEAPPLIRKRLAHGWRREALMSRTARRPPVDSISVPHLI